MNETNEQRLAGVIILCMFATGIILIIIVVFITRLISDNSMHENGCVCSSCTTERDKNTIARDALLRAAAQAAGVIPPPPKLKPPMFESRGLQLFGNLRFKKGSTLYKKNNG